MMPRPDATRPRPRPRPRPNNLASRPHRPRGLNIPANDQKIYQAALTHPYNTTIGLYEYLVSGVLAGIQTRKIITLERNTNKQSIEIIRYEFFRITSEVYCSNCNCELLVANTYLRTYTNRNSVKLLTDILILQTVYYLDNTTEEKTSVSGA